MAKKYFMFVVDDKDENYKKLLTLDVPHYFDSFSIEDIRNGSVLGSFGLRLKAEMEMNENEGKPVQEDSIKEPV